MNGASSRLGGECRLSLYADDVAPPPEPLTEAEAEAFFSSGGATRPAWASAVCDAAAGASLGAEATAALLSRGLACGDIAAMSAGSLARLHGSWLVVVSSVQAANRSSPRGSRSLWIALDHAGSS